MITVTDINCATLAPCIPFWKRACEGTVRKRCCQCQMLHVAFSVQLTDGNSGTILTGHIVLPVNKHSFGQLQNCRALPGISCQKPHPNHSRLTTFDPTL